MLTSLATEMIIGVSKSVADLISVAHNLANTSSFDDASDSDDAFPSRQLSYFAQEGLFQAAIPVEWGGAGLGIEPGSHIQLLQLLKEIGRANLSLGRVYEGHVNAIQLVFAYGNLVQQAGAAADCLSGKLFAVWNTDSADPVRMCEDGAGYWRMVGSKSFASGAQWADRCLVMVEGPGGRQMCLLRKEEMVAKIHSGSWEPFGMRASESYQIDFSGTRVPDSALIGKTGDYYAAPLFLGGSIRTSAVLFGGVEALFAHLRAYLKRFRQTSRPLQQQRAAHIYAALVAGRGWLQYAADEAENGLRAHVDDATAQRMNFAANATRVAIEDLAPRIIRLVTESIGARGLMPPFRFGPLIKDLTMFLRQPNPDDCVLETGRYLLESDKLHV